MGEELLLADVKNYLDITWDDPGTDKKLEKIIMRGKRYLENIAGGPLDFMEEGYLKALLLDYCFYANSGAAHEFEINYKPSLLALRIEKRAESRGEEDQNTSEAGEGTFC